MKKIIITGLLLLTAATGFSQMQIDLRAGASASSFGDQHLKIGYKAGVSAGYLLDGRWGVRTGLFYTVKGATASSNPFNYSRDNATRLSYLELPAEALFQFRIAARAQMAVHAGPYVACLVNSRVPAGSDLTFRRWDAGVTAGFDFIVGHFVVGPDVQYGLTRLTRHSTTPAAHNVTYTLTLGYRF